MNKKKTSLQMFFVFASIVPLVIAVVISSMLLVKTFNKNITESNNNAMTSTVDSIVNTMNYANDMSRTQIKDFATAPIVLESLLNPDNEELAEKLEEYAIAYHSHLQDWDGIYLADWDSKVVAHPVKSAIGMVLRTGDGLTTLRNNMLNSVPKSANDTDKVGLFDIGILMSPATGNLTTSMYCPVFDNDGNPVGFIGGGVKAVPLIERFSDPSSLGFESAYMYFVDNKGSIIYHPDKEVEGTEVTEGPIFDVVERMKNGEHPETTCTKYSSNGKTEYFSFAVSSNNSFVAVLAVDEADILATSKAAEKSAVILSVVLVIVFGALTFVLSRGLVKPFAKITEVTKTISEGNLAADTNINSSINEYNQIIAAENALKVALKDSIGNIKRSADSLNETIIEVDKRIVEDVENVSRISDTIGEVAKTSQQVAEEALNMTEQASILGDSIDELTENIITLKNSANMIAKSNKEASQQVSTVMNSSEESMQAVKEVTDKINETNTALDDIGKCVSVIEDIASRTSLLSLNASIEAARAGEAGRGFAVVAEEIRGLSESTESSLREIKDIIEKVMSLSKETVESSDKIITITSTEREYITETQQKFSVLSDEVDSSLAQIEKIKNMSESLDSVKGSLINATTNLGSISEELGASAEEASANCQMVTDSYTTTKENTAKMKDLDLGVIEAIAFFKGI